MSGYFFESWVLGVVLWALLNVSDYVCTIASRLVAGTGLSLGIQHRRLARTAGRSAPNPGDTPVISRGENVD